jgi:hypothetical protein
MTREQENLVSRRQAFKPIAAAAAASAVGVPAIANAQPSPELHALWNRRRAIRPIYLESQARIAAAEATLPWWAQVGPMYLAHDGTFSGTVVGWPAIRDMEPPTIVGAVRLLRPSKYDLRKDYDTLRRFLGDSAGSRASYRAKLRKLSLRLREQEPNGKRRGCPR